MTRAAALKAAGKRPSESSSGKLPLVLGALIVGLLAWAGFRMMAPGKKKAKVKESEGTSQDEALGLLKDVLLHKGKDGEGAGFSSFSKADYWDERYKKSEKPYDWYGRWHLVKDIVSPILTKSGSVLNVGCGNSRLAEELHADGYTDVTNVDISTAVIEQMAERHSSLGQKFLQMDITKMTFADNSFDAVIDKGTLDALYSGSMPAVKAGIIEIERILRPNGKFVSITFGAPTSRKELNTTEWGKFETHTFQTGSHSGKPHYIHIMTKKS